MEALGVVGRTLPRLCRLLPLEHGGPFPVGAERRGKVTWGSGRCRTGVPPPSTAS